MLSSLKLFLNNATFVFALSVSGGRFCSLLGRKLETAAVLSNVVHHLLQCQSSPSFSGPKLLMLSAEVLHWASLSGLPQPSEGSCCPYCSTQRGSREVPACSFLPGLSWPWHAAAHVVLVLIQWICSRNGLLQEDLMYILLEPASLLDSSFKEKKPLFSQSLASLVCLQRGVVEQTSCINSFCESLQSTPIFQHYFY